MIAGGLVDRIDRAVCSGTIRRGQVVVDHWLWDGGLTRPVDARTPSASSLWSEVATATVDAGKPSARSRAATRCAPRSLRSLRCLRRLAPRAALALSFRQASHRSHRPPQPTAVLGPPALRSSSTGRRSCSLAPLAARACDFRAPARFARGNLARCCLAASLRLARSTARASHMDVGARRRGARAAPAPREGRPTERSGGGSRLGRAWLRAWRTERANLGRASLSDPYPSERSERGYVAQRPRAR